MKYANYKTLHNWLGLFLLLPVMLTALTGVLWMHEKTLGIKKAEKQMMAKNNDSQMTTVPKVSLADTDKLPTTLTASNILSDSNALAMRRGLDAAIEVWGNPDEPLEKIELKDDEMYGLVVKVISVDHAPDKAHEIVWSVTSEEIVDRKGGPKLANGQGGTDWAKVVHDLHTGKWFNERFGFLWADGGALAILFLGFTGVILYALPIMKKRANRKKRLVPA